MSYELCYTSVPQGLRAGTSGFCTVGLTQGTPGPLIERLESLSGYRPLFPAGSAQAAQNPVSWAHWRVSAGGRSYSVLSRVCFAGLDYTQRSNKFAHHVALTANEQPAGGPAWTLLHGNIMRTAWTEAAEFNREPRLPAGDRPPAPCSAWAAACGDAGWAGVLVDAFISAPAKPAYVIYPAQLGMLPLLCEALALVPQQQRWQVTFNTYHTDLPSGVSCAWRCCIAGSSAADEARRSGAVVIDLSTRLPQAPDSRWARLARSGAPELPAAQPSAAEPAAPATFDLADDDELDPLPIAAAPPSYGPARNTGVAPASAGWTRTPVAPLPHVPEASYQEAVPPARPAEAGNRNSPLPAPVSHGGGAKWLVVTVLCSAAVGGGVYFFVQRAKTNGENQLLNDQIASQSKDMAGLQQSFAKAEKANDEMSRKLAAAEKKAAKGPDLDAYVPKTQLEELKAAKDDTQRRFEAQEAELRRLREKPPAPAVAPAPPPAPSTDSSTIVLEPIPEPFQRLDGQARLVFRIDSYPFPVTGSTTVKVGKVEGTAGAQLCQLVPLPLPADTTNDSTYDPKKVEVSRPKAGFPDEPLPLCSFRAEKGAVFMEWPPVAPEDDAKRKEFLRFSMLTVKDDKSSGEIQFFWPNLDTFHPATDSKIGLPREVIGRASTLAFASGSAWVSESALAASAASGKEVVRIYVQDGELRCNYKKILTDKQVEVGEKQAEWNASTAELQKKEGETDPKKMDEAGLKQVKSLFKQKTEEFKQAQEIINDLKNPKSFPDVNALLLARNGVVLWRIRIVFTR